MEEIDMLWRFIKIWQVCVEHCKK